MIAAATLNAKTSGGETISVIAIGFGIRPKRDGNDWVPVKQEPNRPLAIGWTLQKHSDAALLAAKGRGTHG